MICKTCREAADYLNAHREPDDQVHARHLHGKCPDCDCQHRIDIQIAGKTTAVRMAPLGTINQVVE